MVALARPRGPQKVQPEGDWGGFIPELVRPRRDTTSQEIPDIIEFITSDKWLNRPQLYPRQATLLKIIFLQDELFTSFDEDVIGEWTEGFVAPDPERARAMNVEQKYRFEGEWGIQPDVLERIRINKAQGRTWFREVIAAVGRRGSKGFIGAFCAAYVLAHYLHRGDPHRHYGIDPGKPFACFVYGAKKQQAIDNQWGDINRVITEAPYFQKYIGKPLGESLSVQGLMDRERLRAMHSAGVYPLGDRSTFLIQPKEATKVSGRGPASFMQFYDEMAHITREVAKSDAKEIYDAAKPALDQFGKDAFIYEGSSTWQMLGQFYENWEQALEIDQITHAPKRPEMLMFQLCSWDPYTSHRLAPTIPRVKMLTEQPKNYVFNADYHRKPLPPGAKRGTPPESKTFGKMPMDPPSEYNEQMRLEEEANPETFAVERRSKWATALNAYLNAAKVDAMFNPFGPENSITLSQRTEGILSIMYIAHGDPSKSGANFGWSIGHVEYPEWDKRGLPHVFFDRVHAWIPADFPDREIDYPQIGQEIIADVRAFAPEMVTFDQFNSINTIQTIRQDVRDNPLPKQVTVEERTATAALNWSTAETFKTALNLGLVHAPFHDLARAELKFLQDLGNKKIDHPTSGPVQTKDVADTLMIVTADLIGDSMDAYVKRDLSATKLGGALQGGTQPQSQGLPSPQELLSGTGRNRGTGNSPARGMTSRRTGQGGGLTPRTRGRGGR